MICKRKSTKFNSSKFTDNSIKYRTYLYIQLNHQLDETDCISHCTNNLGKGMNSISLPPAMDK